MRREVRPDRITAAHEELATCRTRWPTRSSACATRRRSCCASTARASPSRGCRHKRYADALADVYAQIAVISRVSSIFEEQGVEASGQERYIAETFCTRAARRVSSQLDLLERNDDDRMHSIARLAYKRGAYGYALFED